MVSYADLEKAYRLERANSTLQKLAPDFYEQARRLAESPDAADFKNGILELLERTYYLRFNKIVHYAGRVTPHARPPDNLLALENPLFERIMQAVSENKASIFDLKLEPVAKPKDSPLIKVRVKQALPAIAGPDGIDYGPFREDDVVDLPVESAKLLIERNIAEPV